MRHAITKGLGFTDVTVQQILQVLPTVDAVVLREKHLTETELIEGVTHLLEQGADPKKIIVHSAPNVALRFNLLGCHFAADAHVQAKAWPFLCGQSTHTMAQALDCQQRGMDYIYFSHIFPSNSKKGLPPKGLDALRQVCEATTLPVLALGGITSTNQHLLAATGASGFAAISMFFN